MICSWKIVAKASNKLLSHENDFYSKNVEEKTTAPLGCSAMKNSGS